MKLIKHDPEGGFEFPLEKHLDKRIAKLCKQTIIGDVALFLVTYTAILGTTAILIAEIVVYVAFELLLSAALRALTPGAKSPGRGAGQLLNYSDNEANIRIGYGHVKGLEWLPPC